MLDTKISLTHTGKIGRCGVTGTGYAALLDITIKERYATTHGATCATVILDLLTRYASGLGLTYDATSIVATNICPDLIFRLRVFEPGANARGRRRKRRLGRR